ncbi:MAG: transpeptidase family protein [Marinifilaceae bacterium]|jgi:cell division protein FtsI (penicillin-binding protein 3)|nr:transpeptidase family protein [Marinifilaceae bacterium]
MSIKKDILNKTRWVFILVFIIGLYLILSLVLLKVVSGKKYLDKAEENKNRRVSIPADRGNICAKDGRLLSCSLPMYHIRFDCTLASDTLFKNKVDSLAICLSKYLGENTSNYYSNLFKKERRKGNKYLKFTNKQLTYSELSDFKKFPIFRESRYRGGFIANKIGKRVQPFGNLASRTIGIVRETKFSGLEGQVGLEAAFERDLRGEKGLAIQRKMMGSWIPFESKSPKDGNDIISTIDVNFQDIAQESLEKQLRKYEAEAGVVILMEVKTGAIRAIANLGLSKDGNYYEDYNRAIGEANEYGSIFKLATMIAILEDGYVSPTDIIDTGNGRWKLYDRILTDAHRGGFGKLSVQEVFEKSSNVGFGKMINNNYKKHPKDFIERLYSMCLNKKLNISIHGEGKPRIKFPGDKDWYGTTLAWTSIGYEVQITPLQMLTLYNAVANNGVMVKPRFVEEIRSRNRVIKKMDTEIILPKLCSNKTLGIIQSMLVGVVERGTGRGIRSNDYKIAGKTGTALISEGKQGYSNKKYFGSFAGYFPADNPMYSCIVVIKNPNKKKGYYGSKVAAPLFRILSDEVYAQTYSLHKNKGVSNKKALIPFAVNKSRDLEELSDFFNFHYPRDIKDDSWIRVTSSKKYKFYKKKISKYIMPNLTGLTLKDAIYILENMGMKVSYTGVGKVFSQSIIAGAKVKKGMFVKIDLK